MDKKQYFKAYKARKAASKPKYKVVKTRPKTKKAVLPRNLAVLGKGLPKRVLVTHKYVETASINCSSGGVGSYNWNCNGLYDPNQSGFGHQPMYFDQMSALYNHYTVIGSRIKVTFAPLNISTGGVPNSQQTMAVGLYINDDSVITPSGMWNLAEQTQAKIKTICPAANVPVVLTSNWSAKKTFGGSVLGNPNLRGNASANPSEVSIFSLYAQPYDITSSCSLYFMVEIEYIAVWSELKDILSS